MRARISTRSLTTAIGAVLAALAAATAFAGFTGTDVFLPSVGAKPGVPPAVWYTTVWVHNPNLTTANVTFSLLERQANLAPKSYTDTIPAGDTKRYDDAVKTMFGVEAFGAIRVAANVKVLAGARIYSQAGTLDDSVGQFFAGTPAAFSIGNGQSTELTAAWQTQPSADSTFRFNFGFVETTGSGTCQVKVTVKDPTGAPLGNKTYTVRQWEQMQKSFASEFPGLSTDNARLTVEVTSGSGRVIAFGSSVANGSQDPATVEMAFRDELLGGGSGGLAEVAHDATLTGSGTVGSPLGLANSAVTSEKIADGTIKAADVGATAITTDKIANGAVNSDKIEDGTIKPVDLTDSAVTTLKIAAGAVTLPRLAVTGTATAGKILSTDGAGLVWQSPATAGLTLPYTGHADTTAEAFEIINDKTTGGVGIMGESKSGAGKGVWGFNGSSSGEAIGVMASSPNSSSGIGLKAEVTGPNATAVMGTSYSATGATYGVAGEARSSNGYGVRGNYSGTGSGAGVLGESSFTGGLGGRFQGSRGLLALSNGSGTSHAAIDATSLHGSGISIFAHQSSNDAVIVGTNEGSGRLLKLFSGTGGSNLRFVVENNGDVKADGTYTSPAADFAELLPAHEGLEPGDVLAVDIDGRLTRSTSAYQSSVVGVYSTKPGFLGGSSVDAATDGLVPLAVVGVVPVKVTATNGPILPGDILVASPVPGHAMKAKPLEVQGVKIYPAGTLLGKALGRYDGPGTGTITALINTK